MDFKDLTIIKDLNTTKSISRTAENLYMSQPAITYRINRMEKEFGSKLLTRHSGGVIFTHSGEHLLEYSNKFLHELDILKNKLSSERNDIAGSVNLYVSITFAKHYLAQIMKKFESHYPNISLNLTTCVSRKITHDVIVNKNIDILIARSDDIDINLEKIVILKEPYGIISSSPIDLNQLNSITRIKHPYSPEAIIDKWCEKVFTKKFSGKVISVDSIETNLALVSQGLGWTILPKIHLFHHKSLFFYPLDNNCDDSTCIKTMIIYNKDSCSQVVNKTVDFFAQNVK